MIVIFVGCMTFVVVRSGRHQHELLTLSCSWWQRLQTAMEARN